MKFFAIVKHYDAVAEFLGGNIVASVNIGSGAGRIRGNAAINVNRNF